MTEEPVDQHTTSSSSWRRWIAPIGSLFGIILLIAVARGMMPGSRWRGLRNPRDQ